MGPRLFLILCFVSLALAALAAVAVGVWQIYLHLPEHGHEIASVVIVYGGGIAFLLVAVVAVLWGYLDYAIAQPLATVVRGIQTTIHANPEHRIGIDDFHQLDGLPAAVNNLIDQLASARRHTDEAVTQATASIEQQKNRLESILRDLHEGVLVCTLQHRILLYNHRALQLLRIGGNLGLDRSLFTFMTRRPIVHALERLNNRGAEGRDQSSGEQNVVTFVGSTVDGLHTLEGRISLILDGCGSASGYVLSFEDNTLELAAFALRDRLLREATEGLRAPVANLHAAAEILCGTSELSAGEQEAFKDVVLRESKTLCGRLEHLAGQYREIITGHWPMSDLFSASLFHTLAGRLQEQRGIVATIVGLPHWLHGDSYTLVELLDRLIARICVYAGTESVDLEAVSGERRIYLDVVWRGPVVPAATLHGWLGETLEQTLGGLGLRDVLERHRTDVWCLAERDGLARLRMPLPPANRVNPQPEDDNKPPRPEFYDFDLLNRPVEMSDLGPRPLRGITYVVVDCETTGLEPAGGDEIVAIAGVRIVNGRILTGESFERLVNPGRRIPITSTRFHGITDATVRDKPPIQVVLPQFRSFVGDAVLIAHNAAFDLKFLKLKESECGVTFDMPVLDTLLLSAFLHDHTPQHSLEAVAQRFGVPVQGRHSAIGDALVTAGVFLRMIDVLAARGITTLDQALAAAQTIVDVRARQAAF